LLKTSWIRSEYQEYRTWKSQWIQKTNFQSLVYTLDVLYNEMNSRDFIMT